MADPTAGTDPATIAISGTPASPRAVSSIGIVNALSGPLAEILGGSARVVSATTNQTANVISSTVGPALLLVLGGFALAVYARRHK